MLDTEIRKAFCLESIVDASDAAVVVCDRDHRCLYANQAAARLIHTSPEEALGHTFAELLQATGEFVPFSRQRIDEGFARQEVLHVEECVRLDGGIVWGQSVLVPIVENGQMTALGIAYRDITPIKLAQQALGEAHNDLLKAREEERRHLARDLHDSVGQELAGMQMEIASLRRSAGQGLREELEPRLARLLEKCRQLLQEVRQMSYGLYPPMLEQYGLYHSLEHLLRTVATETEAHLQCEEQVQAMRFPADVEVEAYRIAQEALNNALRHGHPHRVDVELLYSQGQLVLSIRNDGEPFDVKSIKHRGLGLTSMQERATSIGGTLGVSSRTGLTVVDVHIPAQPL